MDHPTDPDDAGSHEHPPADLMAIYLACDEAPGDTDDEIAAFGEVYGGRP